MTDDYFTFLVALAGEGDVWARHRLEPLKAARRSLASNRRTLQYFDGVTDSEKMLAKFPRMIWGLPWSPPDYSDYQSESQDSLWIDV